MKLIRKIMSALVLVSTFGLAATALTAQAADAPAANPTANPANVQRAQEALKKDAICTKCHDESESAPVLSIYQTKHGVKGDPKAPNCQSCHGASDKHVKGDPVTKVRAAPDVVFKKGAFKLSGDKERAGQCLTCHKDTKRNNWDGGKHDTSGVACKLTMCWSKKRKPKFVTPATKSNVPMAKKSLITPLMKAKWLVQIATIHTARQVPNC
jgi:cytochrome c553